MSKSTAPSSLAQAGLQEARLDPTSATYSRPGSQLARHPAWARGGGGSRSCRSLAEPRVCARVRAEGTGRRCAPRGGPGLLSYTSRLLCGAVFPARRRSVWCVCVARRPCAQGAAARSGRAAFPLQFSPALSSGFLGSLVPPAIRLLSPALFSRRRDRRLLMKVLVHPQLPSP